MLKHLITKEKIYNQQRKYLLWFLVLFIIVNTWLANKDLLTLCQGIISLVLASFAGQLKGRKYADTLILFVSSVTPFLFSFYLNKAALLFHFQIVAIFQIIYLTDDKRTRGFLLFLCIVSGCATSIIQEQSYSYTLARGITLIFFSFITSQTIDYLLETQTALRKSFSERSRIGNELDETKAFQRLLLDGTDYVIIAVDNNWVITEFNRAAIQLLGYEPEEVIGKQTPLIFHDDNQVEQRTQEINERYHAGISKGAMTFHYKNKIGIPNSNEWIFITKSGKRLNVWLTISTLKDHAGKVVGHIGVAQDITAKRFLEQQQHTAETIIANSPSVLFKWNNDRNYTTLYVSANVDQLLGYTSLDFTSHKVRYMDLMLPEDLLALADLTEQIRNGATSLQKESRLRHKNGDVICVEERIYIKRNDAGRVEYYEGVIIDITRNKQVQEELKASELRYELAARGIAAGIWDWLDVSKPDMWLSERYFELLGYTQGEVKPCLDVFRAMLHPEDLGIVDRQVQLHFEHNTPFLVECRMKTKSGVYNWFTASGVAYRDKEGKPVRMVGSIIDINHKKLNEELLRMSEERYRLLVEAASDIFYNTNSLGKFTYVNEVAVSLTEYSMEELFQMRYFDLVREDHKENVKDFYRHQTSALQDVTYIEFPIMTKSGKTKWLGQNVRIVTENGSVKSWQAVARDITGMRHTEKQLREYTHTLERTIKDLDEFSYLVSNNLKAPLHNISYLAECIREQQHGYLTQESKDLFEVLRSRVHRMEEFVSQLIVFSQTGRSAPKMERVNIRSLIRELVQLLHAGPGVRVEMAVVDLEFETDTVLLEQVLNNLIGNAIRYNNSSDPLVRIECDTQDNKLVFSISDNGPGIEKKDHGKIFKMFQTVNMDENRENNGIGLAIVKKILEERNELIILESEPGKGSKFSFTWNIH